MVGELEKERRGDASLFMLVGTCTQGRDATISLSKDGLGGRGEILVEACYFVLFPLYG